MELRGGTHLVLVPGDAAPGDAPFDLMVEDLRRDTSAVDRARARRRARSSTAGSTTRSIVTDPDGHRRDDQQQPRRRPGSVADLTRISDAARASTLVPVEDAGEAARHVLAERELLEHAEPDAIAPRARITCWMWMFHGSTLSSSSTLCSSEPTACSPCQCAVAPLGVRVAEAAHPEREQRLELDHARRRRCAAAGRSVAPCERRRPGAQRTFAHRVGQVLDAARRRLGAPRRVAVADESAAPPGSRRSGRRCRARSTGSACSSRPS